MSWLETALNGVAVQLKGLKENKLNKDEASKIFQKRSDAFSGKWVDIKGKPSLHRVATTGNYYDLTGAPNVSTVGQTGMYSDLYGKPDLATIATSGSYNDLSNKPQLSTVATTGKYSDLLSTPDTLEYNLILSDTINTSLEFRVEAYGAGVFVAFCYNNRGDTEYAAYSVDCINWTKTKLPQDAQWRKIIYGGNKFVALGDTSSVYDTSSLVAYSEDGIIWEETNLPVALPNWWTITYGNGRFVAVALDANVAAYSLDGITWEQSILPREMSVWDITFGNGKFIGVTDDGAALISTDGIK